MKKYRIVSIYILTTLMVLSTSCQGSQLKTPSGINPIWIDEVGYLSKAATVIQEDNARYVIYETNEKINDETISFALKIGHYENDAWEYSNREIILKGSDSSWDKYIFSPSVIKGEFKKGAETYNYLLAYGGRKTSNDIANQIGIAYAKELTGPWIKHPEPLIKYDAGIYGDEYGAGAPSLVSYDKKGKVRIFYSYAETNLANERVLDADLSDLNNIILDKGTRQISVDGLRDNADMTILANADFALDENDTLYVVRDVYPLSSNIPGNATSLQVAKANVKILNDFVNYSWEVIETFNSSNTIDFDDPESMGWDEIYSAAFVRDSYGYISSTQDKLEYIYSTSDEPEDISDETYKFSPFLAIRSTNF